MCLAAFVGCKSMLKPIFCLTGSQLKVDVDGILVKMKVFPHSFPGNELHLLYFVTALLVNVHTYHDVKMHCSAFAQRLGLLVF